MHTNYIRQWTTFYTPHHIRIEKDYNGNMEGTNSAGLILLTYKGKILLMHKQKSVIDEEIHPWCLIGGVRKNQESFEHALSRSVEKETGVKIKNVELLSKFCYHAALTDDNVNNIKRSENQLLDFFNPKELNKLLLSETTREFIYNNTAFIPVL